MAPVRAAFDKEKSTSEYVRFAQLVKSKYPNAKNALLSSPIMSGYDKEILKSGLSEDKRRVDALYLSDSPVAFAYTIRGCLGHPFIEDHALLAQELAPFFQQLISVIKISRSGCKSSYMIVAVAVPDI